MERHTYFQLPVTYHTNWIRCESCDLTRSNYVIHIKLGNMVNIRSFSKTNLSTKLFHHTYRFFLNKISHFYWIEVVDEKEISPPVLSTLSVVSIYSDRLGEWTTEHVWIYVCPNYNHKHVGWSDSKRRKHECK